jgi:hypothetical protein
MIRSIRLDPPIALAPPPKTLIATFVKPGLRCRAMETLVICLLFHSGALSLYNHDPSILSSLDLNHDMILPPYLSLPTMINIIKLIRDDDCMIQDASKELLLDCLENMEEIDPEAESKVPSPEPATMVAKEPTRKRRAKKVADPVDTKLVQHKAQQGSGWLQSSRCCHS